MKPYVLKDVCSCTSSNVCDCLIFQFKSSSDVPVQYIGKCTPLCVHVNGVYSIRSLTKGQH